MGTPKGATRPHNVSCAYQYIISRYTKLFASWVAALKVRTPQQRDRWALCKGGLVCPSKMAHV